MIAATRQSYSNSTASMSPAMRPVLCAVSLIDRRTGSVHRVNGRPVLVVTRAPNDAATELMTGRSPAVWRTRIETIEQATR